MGPFGHRNALALSPAGRYTASAGGRAGLMPMQHRTEHATGDAMLARLFSPRDCKPPGEEPRLGRTTLTGGVQVGMR